MKQRTIMSASVNGSDIQTLLNATQGLGSVEGNDRHSLHSLCSLIGLNVSQHVVSLS